MRKAPIYDITFFCQSLVSIRVKMDDFPTSNNHNYTTHTYRRNHNYCIAFYLLCKFRSILRFVCVATAHLKINLGHFAWLFVACLHEHIISVLIKRPKLRERIFLERLRTQATSALSFCVLWHRT